MDDPQWVTVAEDLFSKTDAIVIAAFQVSKRVHGTDATGSQLLQSLGGQARRRKDFEPRLLCFTVKRSQADREFKGTLHMCKVSSHGQNYEVSKSWPLRCITHITTGSRKTDQGVMKCAKVIISPHSGQPEHTVEYGFHSSDLLMFFLSLIVQLLRHQAVEVPALTGVSEETVHAWWEANLAKIKSSMNEFAAGLMTEGGLENKKEGSSVLVSAKEEKDLEQLLDMFAMGIGDVEEFESRLTDEYSALEAANVHAMLESTALVDNVFYQLRKSQTMLEDMDESLKVFDFKLRTMREDIAAIEESNNMLELQARNNAKLLTTVETLINDLNLPIDALRALSAPDFHPENMGTVIAAAQVLHERLQRVDAESGHGLNPLLMNLNVVRETQRELVGLTSKFVSTCKKYLEEMLSHLANEEMALIDRMQGGFRLPKHETIRGICGRHTELLRVVRDLDPTTMGSLQLFYCQNMNRLIRKELRLLITDMKKSVGADRAQSHKMAGSESTDDDVLFMEGDLQLHEAFAVMLDSVIPFLLDELDFTAQFLLLYREERRPKASDTAKRTTFDDEDILQLPPIATKGGVPAKELNAQGRSVMEVLFRGVEVEFMVPVELTARGNQVVTIPMMALVNKWLAKLSGMSIAEFLTKSLSTCNEQLSANFKAFIKQQEANIVKFDNRATVAFSSRSGEGAVKHLKVLPFITQFALLANHMEVMLAESVEPESPLARSRSPGGGYGMRNSPTRREREQRKLQRQLTELDQAVMEEARNQIRAEVDDVYKRLIEAMFATLERLAQTDPKHGDRLRLENYTYFTDSVRPLVQHVPALKSFLTHAEHVQEECLQHYVQQQLEYGKLWKLLELSERIDKLLVVVGPAEVAFQMNCSAGEVRSMLKDTMSGVDKKISSMHVRVKKHLAGNSNLTMKVWQALHVDLISRYTRLEQQVGMCYPSVTFKPTSDELREVFRTCIS